MKNVTMISLSSISMMINTLPSISQNYVVIVVCFCDIIEYLLRLSLSKCSICSCYAFFECKSFFCNLSFQIIGPVITTESRYKKLLPSSHTANCMTYIVLDIRKEVAARNDFVSVVDGRVEATLYSTLSADQTTRIRYIHVPYSSGNTEGNVYQQMCAAYQDVTKHG